MCILWVLDHVQQFLQASQGVAGISNGDKVGVADMVGVELIEEQARVNKY